MIAGTPVNIDLYELNLKEVTKEMKMRKDEEDFNTMTELLTMVPENKYKKLQRIVENKCSTWLSITPTQDNFFSMSPDESEMLWP